MRSLTAHLNAESLFLIKAASLIDAFDSIALIVTLRLNKHLLKSEFQMVVKQRQSCKGSSDEG